MDQLDKALTTREALLSVMSKPKWYADIPNCEPQLAYYYKKQAAAGTLSQLLTDRILNKHFIKIEEPTQWKPKPLRNG